MDLLKSSKLCAWRQGIREFLDGMESKMKVYNSKKDIVSRVTQEDGRYTIVTNGVDNFWNSDSVTFVYDEFEYPYEERSSFDIEVTVRGLESTENHASTGIMIRGEAADDAANVFLLVRRTYLAITWRPVKGSGTKFMTHQWTDGIVLPCRLRLHMVGNVFTAYYQYGDENGWKRLTSGTVEIGSRLLAGIGAYSSKITQMAEMVLDGLSMQVINRRPENREQGRVVREVSDNVLFLEDFEYGKLNAYPEGRYSFSGIRAANILPTVGADGKPTYAWLKDHMSGSHFAGSKHWADYAFSLNLRFDESCSLEESNTFAAYVRHREMDFYGVSHYGIYLTDGNMLSLRKVFTAQTSDEILEKKEFLYLQDPGTWHNLRIEAFDNRITVLWDGEEVLSYTDEDLAICPVGGIGFMTDETAVWLDDLTVYELEDVLGGAYDNLIGGLWDQPAPEDFKYDYENGMHCVLPVENPEEPAKSSRDQRAVAVPEENTKTAERTGRILYTGNTWQSAGDIVTLFGGDIGSCAEKITAARIADAADGEVSYFPVSGYDFICGKEENVRWAAVEAETAMKTESAAKAECSIIQKTASLVKFRMPDGAADGIYAVCVQLADGTEETAYLNLPRIHFVLGDEGDTVTPGGTIRVSGENICRENSPAEPRLCLKNGEREYVLAAVRTEPDNMAEFPVPNDAVYGEYEVTVQNGYGDGRCWSVPKRIIVGPGPRENWPTEVFDIRDYGAKGIGCWHNDTPGVIAALRAAEANGGGIVLVPRGTYMLTHPISIPENVHLKGEGIIKSKIIWYPYNWDTGELPDYAIWMKSNAEISGIDFSGTRLGPLFVSRGKGARNIYLHDCRIFMTPYNGSPTNAHPRGNGLEPWQAYSLAHRELNYWEYENAHVTFCMQHVDNLQIYDNDINIDIESCGISASHCKNVYIARNRNNAGLRTNRSERVLIEYCETTRSMLAGDNIYFAHNYLHDSNHNNRELMTTDGSGYLEHSDQYYVCAADESGYEYEVPFPFEAGTLIGTQLVIFEGPGEGQMRRIIANEGMRITIDSPFAIAPAAKDSKIYILDPRSNVIVVNNRLYNGGDFQFYGTQLNSIIARNEFEKVRGISLRARPYYGTTNPQWYLSVEKNRLRDANFLHHHGWAPVSMRYKTTCKIHIECSGPRWNTQLCLLVRGNTLEDGFYIYLIGGNKPGDYVGLTVQGNLISDAEKAIVCNLGPECEGVLFADNREENSEAEDVLPKGEEFFEAAQGTNSPKYRYL